MDETIKQIEEILGRKVTDDELRVIRLSHLISYEKGKADIWNMAKDAANGKVQV